MSTVDIVVGDVLVVGGKDYPIRSVAEWDGFPPGSLAFKRMATVTASTKRSPALSSGVRGAMTTNLASVKCTPLDPVDPDLRSRLKLNTPHELLECFVDGTPYLRLILEDLKT